MIDLRLEIRGSHYAFICGIVFVIVAFKQPWLWVMWPNWLTHLSLFLIFHSIWLLLFLLVRFPPVSPLWYNMAKLTKLHHHHLVEAEFAFHLISIPCFNPRKKAIVVYIFLIIFLWTYPILPSIWYFLLGPTQLSIVARLLHQHICSFYQSKEASYFIVILYFTWKSKKGLYLYYSDFMHVVTLIIGVENLALQLCSIRDWLFSDNGRL